MGGRSFVGYQSHKQDGFGLRRWRNMHLRLGGRRGRRESSLTWTAADCAQGLLDPFSCWLHGEDHLGKSIVLGATTSPKGASVVDFTDRRLVEVHLSYQVSRKINAQGCCRYQVKWWGKCRPPETKYDVMLVPSQSDQRNPRDEPTSNR